MQLHKLTVATGTFTDACRWVNEHELEMALCVGGLFGIETCTGYISLLAGKPLC